MSRRSHPYGDGRNETLESSRRLGERAGAGLHPRGYGARWTSATSRSSRRLRSRRRWWWCPTTRSARGAIDEIALQLVRALAWTWRHARWYAATRAHRRGRHSRAGICRDAAGLRVASGVAHLPRGLVRAALAVSGIFDLEPLPTRRSCKATCGSRPTPYGVPSPAYFPARIGHAACPRRELRSENSCARTR